MGPFGVRMALDVMVSCAKATQREGFQVPDPLGKRWGVSVGHGVSQFVESPISIAAIDMSTSLPGKTRIDPIVAQEAARQLRQSRIGKMTFAVMEVDTYVWGTIQLHRRGAYAEPGLHFEIIIQPSGVEDVPFSADRDVVLAALFAKESPLEKALAANHDALRCIAAYDSATHARVQASDIAPPKSEGDEPMPKGSSARLFARR